MEASILVDDDIFMCACMYYVTPSPHTNFHVQISLLWTMYTHTHMHTYMLNLGLYRNLDLHVLLLRQELFISRVGLIQRRAVIVSTSNSGRVVLNEARVILFIWTRGAVAPVAPAPVFARGACFRDLLEPRMVGASV